MQSRFAPQPKPFGTWHGTFFLPSVAGNTATITTVGPNDARLTLKLTGQYIGG